MPGLTHCPLTRTPLIPPVQLTYEFNGYDYKIDSVGHVKIGIHVVNHLENYTDKLFILAGICRNKFENGENPVIINTDFIDNQLDNIIFPHNYVQQRFHLLNYIYKKSGSEREPFTFSSILDYPIAYCKNQDKFIQLMDDLSDSQLIKVKYRNELSNNRILYQDVVLSDDGEQTIGKFGMILNFDLESQDPNIDRLFAHSKELFFKHHSSIEDKRSACFDLSQIVENIGKNQLKTAFADADVEFLSGIINNYSIRHNKDRTKELKRIEQVEWIYYSLMITIITYFKLKNNIN